MTDNKKLGGKLTEKQLELGLEVLETRTAAQRGKQNQPGAKKNSRAKNPAGKDPKPSEKKADAADRIKPEKNAPKSGAAERSPKAEKTSAPAKTPPKQKSQTKGAQQSKGGQQPAANRNNNSKGGKKPQKQHSAAVESAQSAKTAPAEKSPAGRGQPRPAAAKKPPAKNANTGAQGRRGRNKKEQKSQTPVRIIPLGGMMEVGKNVTLFECQNDMLMVDCGMTFPDEQMLGVDLVLPDFTYVVKNKDRLRGIVITHGHEDHIGSLAYFLKQVDVPVYATKLTIGLIENKLKEHGLSGKVRLIQIMPKETFKLGCMEVEFIRVNHSIPDAVGLAIHTPAGTIVHTGDFKIDYTPIIGDVIDLARFGELGSQGVLALLADSTNAERPGFAPSEVTVREGFDKLFKQAVNKRMIVATFSSNVHRVQHICEAAGRYGRKVAVSGRSMVNMVNTAMELGYLTPPAGIMIDIDDINRYPHEQIIIITTGSQGEAMSALSRMASNDHRKVSVTREDFIVVSATPIPGNEKTVSRVVNDLLRLGAEVIYERMYDVHVSGHACQEELKVMLALTRPKFFFPVHGEYKHLKRHAALATSMGIPEQNVIIGENGHVMELDGISVKREETVQAGQVLVDGLGVGDVGSIVLRDRKHLGQDGLIIVVMAIEKATGQLVAGPDIISRGFVYVREAEDMLAKAREVAKNALGDCQKGNVREWSNIKIQVRDALSSYFYGITKRSPMILPVIQEI